MQQQEPVMDWPAVVAAIHRQGMTIDALAKMNDIPRKGAARVRSTTHYKMQQVIAEFLGHKPEDLWPSRYPKGKPRILDTSKYPDAAKEIAQPGADKKDAA
jgi:Ner family transcriptional regulator